MNVYYDHAKKVEAAAITARYTFDRMANEAAHRHAQEMVRRERLERFKVAVRGAGLDSSDVADLISLIDEALTREGGRP